MNSALRLLIPPILPMAVRKGAQLLGIRNLLPKPSLTVEVPRWCSILKGPLAGRPILLNPDAQQYQQLMLKAEFDDFLFDYVDRRDWSGKTIYDIGAHVGYHTMNFAHRVGEDGRVFAFEPHPSHQQRLRTNLSRNKDLESRVTLMPVAVSNKAGRIQFYCTESVEGSGSSMSFIAGSSTPFPASFYHDYNAIHVESAKLDDLVAGGNCLPPDLMKIDVEGAESLVVEGALGMLRQYKPSLLIGVHSLVNMLHVACHLQPLGYSFTLLEEKERRCFLAVEPTR
jgi:FkbM family methyltransferase